MTDNQMLALLSEVLKSQPENGKHRIAYARFRQAFTTGPKLSEIEIEKLWLSASNIREYLHAKKAVHEESMANWNNSTWKDPQRKLAASSKASVDFYSLEFDDYAIFIEKAVAGYVITLKLSEKLRKSLAKIDHLQLVDEFDETWIDGTPNGEATMMANWTLSNDINDYLSREVTLRLK